MKTINEISYTGTKFNPEMTLSDIASMIKEGIRKQFPQVKKISVKKGSSGNSIYITIRAWDPRFRVVNPAYIKAFMEFGTQGHLYPPNVQRLTYRARQLLKKIESLSDEYNRDDSAPEYDHFDRHFYLYVNFDHSAVEQEAKILTKKLKAGMKPVNESKTIQEKMFRVEFSGISWKEDDGFLPREAVEPHVEGKNEHDAVERALQKLSANYTQGIEQVLTIKVIAENSKEEPSMSKKVISEEQLRQIIRSIIQEISSDTQERIAMQRAQRAKQAREGFKAGTGPLPGSVAHDEGGGAPEWKGAGPEGKGLPTLKKPAAVPPPVPAAAKKKPLHPSLSVGAKPSEFSRKPSDYAKQQAFSRKPSEYAQNPLKGADVEGHVDDIFSKIAANESFVRSIIRKMINEDMGVPGMAKPGSVPPPVPSESSKLIAQMVKQGKETEVNKLLGDMITHGKQTEAERLVAQIIKAAKSGKVRYNVASLPDFSHLAQMEEAIRKIAGKMLSEAKKTRKAKK